MGRLLENMGAEFHYEPHKAVIAMNKIQNLEAPYELVKEMRASVLVLGPCWQGLAAQRSLYPEDAL